MNGSNIHETRKENSKEIAEISFVEAQIVPVIDDQNAPLALNKHFLFSPCVMEGMATPIL